MQAGFDKMHWRMVNRMLDAQQKQEIMGLVSVVKTDGRGVYVEGRPANKI